MLVKTFWSSSGVSVRPVVLAKFFLYLVKRPIPHAFRGKVGRTNRQLTVIFAVDLQR